MKGGSFRGIIAAVAAAIGMQSGPRHYADPVFSDPRSRRKKRAHGHVSKGRFRVKSRNMRAAPKCVPGTITYRDWLVRELGYDRRLADGYEYAFLNGYKVKMPLPSDAISNLRMTGCYFESSDDSMIDRDATITLPAGMDFRTPEQKAGVQSSEIDPEGSAATGPVEALEGEQR